RFRPVEGHPLEEVLTYWRCRERLLQQAPYGALLRAASQQIGRACDRVRRHDARSLNRAVVIRQRARARDEASKERVLVLKVDQIGGVQLLQDLPLKSGTAVG